MLTSNVKPRSERDLIDQIMDYVSRDKVYTTGNENSTLFRKGYKGNRILEISIKPPLGKSSHPKSMRIEVTNVGIGQYGELLEVNFNEDGSPDIKSYIKLDSGRKIHIRDEFPDKAGAQNQYCTTRSSLEGICEVLR